MKRFFILLFLLHTISVLHSQQIEIDSIKECPPSQLRVNACYREKNGIIVVHTDLKGLVFKIINAEERLLDQRFEPENNRYILCVEPKDREISIYNFQITSSNTFTRSFIVQDIEPSRPRFFCVYYTKKNIIHNTSSIPNNVNTGSTKALSGKVTGIVVDKSGEPIIGCSILEKGTTHGTVSDIDGKFELSISNIATLKVSYIGCKDEERIVFPGENIKIVLEDALGYPDFRFYWKTITAGLLINSKFRGESVSSDIRQSGFQAGWICFTFYPNYTYLSLIPKYEYRIIKLAENESTHIGYIQLPLDVGIPLYLLKLGSIRNFRYGVSVGPYVNFKLHGNDEILLNETKWDVNSTTAGININAKVTYKNAAIGLRYSIGLTDEYTKAGDTKSLKVNNLYLNAFYRF